MTNKYKDDVDENGYPLDKGYLEVGLPSMLQESIDKMKITNQLIKEGKQCLDWCMLNSNINIFEVEGIISSEQAWYLREKYLGMKREDNIG